MRARGRSPRMSANRSGVVRTAAHSPEVKKAIRTTEAALMASDRHLVDTTERAEGAEPAVVELQRYRR